MKILAVSVGLPREIEHRGHRVLTGIFKQAVAGRVMLRRLGLDGDGQADLQVHGGPDKAAYAYPAEHYEAWRRELGRDDLAPGGFGENLTVSGMCEEAVRVGDVYRLGSAVVQVTQPRGPCVKLAIRMGDPHLAKPFLERGRTGFYLRVLAEGEVGAGDDAELLAAEAAGMTVAEICHLHYFARDDREGARRALGIAGLSASWRRKFEQWAGER